MEHPNSLWRSAPYSQALPIRQICSTFQDYHSHSRKLIEQFVDKGYKEDVVIQQIQKINQLDWKQQLHQQKDFSMLPIIAFRKELAWNKSLAQIPSITMKNLDRLKIFIVHESVSHAIQHVAFAVNNLFQRQHSKLDK